MPVAAWPLGSGDISIFGFGWGCTFPFETPGLTATAYRRAFAQVRLICQLHVPLYQLESPAGSHSCRDHVIIGVLPCTLHRAFVEDHPEATANSKHRVGNNNRYFLLCLCVTTAT